MGHYIKGWKKKERRVKRQAKKEVHTKDRHIQHDRQRNKNTIDAKIVVAQTERERRKNSERKRQRIDTHTERQKKKEGHTKKEVDKIQRDNLLLPCLLPGKQGHWTPELCLTYHSNIRARGLVIYMQSSDAPTCCSI